MKIIYNKHIPFKGYAALNFFGIIFARKEFDPLSHRTLNHERIHTAQMKEMLYFVFYLWYGIEWIVRLVQHQDSKEAYYNISFEREAYANEMQSNYLKVRRFWSWWGYMRK